MRRRSLQPATGSVTSTSIPLNIAIAATDIDGSETLGRIAVSGVPEGYLLSAGFQDASGAWVLTPAQLAGLALVPATPDIAAGNVALTVSATTLDGTSSNITSAVLPVTIAAAANQQSGFAIDGYIAGATVFADANGNGTHTSIGTTTLIVTHDQEEALALADRIAIMSAGRVLQLDTPRAVYERPACRFVAEFLGRSLWLEGRLHAGVFTTHAGIAVPCPPPERVAAAYGLLLRPEHLELRTPREGEAALPATVLALRYHGQAMQVMLLVEGAPLTLDLPHREAWPEPGDAVTLAVMPAAGRAVPAT